MNSIKIGSTFWATLLIIISVYFIKYKSKKEIELSFSKDRLHQTQSDLIDLQNKSRQNHDLQFLALADEGAIWPDKIKIYDEDLKLIPISQILDIHANLVFRFSQSHCQDCVEQELKLLSDLVKKYGISRIILLAEYPSKRILKIWMKNLDLESLPIYRIEKPLPFHAENANSPYYFIIGKDKRIKKFYIVTLGELDNSKRYHELVLNNSF